MKTITSWILEVCHHDVKVDIVGNVGLNDAMKWNDDRNVAVGVTLVRLGNRLIDEGLNGKGRIVKTFAKTYNIVKWISDEIELMGF